MIGAKTLRDEFNQYISELTNIRFLLSTAPILKTSVGKTPGEMITTINTIIAQLSNDTLVNNISLNDIVNLTTRIENINVEATKYLTEMRLMTA